MCAEEAGEVSLSVNAEAAAELLELEGGARGSDGVFHGVRGAGEATVRDEDGIRESPSVQDAAGGCGVGVWIQ